MTHGTLILPAKSDVERDGVAVAWSAGGGSVLRLDRFWEPPQVDPTTVALYGPDTFALVVAQVLGLELASPADDLLLRAPTGLLRRRVESCALREIDRLPFPVFAKPLVPKQFRAAVWQGADALREECAGLTPEAQLIVSEVVTVEGEARAWVLAGEVVSCALYEGEGSIEEAAAFLGACAAELPLPEACVLDAARTRGAGWCLLEANAAWGAGLNGCDPGQACRCIERATRVRRPA